MTQLSGQAWFWIAICSVAVGGLLSSIFHSIKEMSRARLEEIAAIRNVPSAIRRIDAIIKEPDQHAAAAAMLRIMLNLLASIAVVFYVASVRQPTAIPGTVAPILVPDLTDVAVSLVCTSLLVWIFGFFIPQSVARHASEVTVYVFSSLIRALYVICKPVRGVASFIDEVIRRLAGREHEDHAVVIQQELMSVFEEAQEDGQFDAREKGMLEAVVRFRDLTARQVMTPRTEIEAMEYTNSLSEVTAYIRHCAHSRIPVYRDSLDTIVGIFYVKDLMRWLAGEGSRGGKTFELTSILRSAIFIPETKTVRETLEEMIAKKVHIAVVADEFGGTAGIITIEDIMEEIVGEIQDEYETQKEVRVDIAVDASTRSAVVDARAYIDDVNEAIRTLGVGIPESEDYETIAGFVSVTLGRIPAVGEEVRVDALRVVVLEAEPMRVTRVRVESVEERQGMHGEPEPFSRSGAK